MSILQVPLDHHLAQQIRVYLVNIVLYKRKYSQNYDDLIYMIQLSLSAINAVLVISN